MYYLFLDESGDDNLSRQPVGANNGRSQYITVGGIIVKDTDISKFDNEFGRIMQKYFSGLTLPQKFKLHYTTLKRGQKYPYREIHNEGRCSLSHEIFDTVKKIDCQLISCTIDKIQHLRNYGNNAKNPKAYALLICVERFDQFLRENSESGVIIYEEFNSIRKKMGSEINDLLQYPNFPNYQNLKDVEKIVNHGKPNQYPLLQFADFIAHIIWFHKTQPNQIVDIFSDFTNKFYNYPASSFFSGYVEI